MMKKILFCLCFLMIAFFGYAKDLNKHIIISNIDAISSEVKNIIPTWYRDKDGDGFGASIINEAPVKGIQPPGYVSNSSDIDDTNSNITNIPPQTFYRDADGDTFW